MLTEIATGDQDAALQSASDWLDGYLRKQYALPLTSYGADVTEMVCKRATWSLMRVRGFDPEDPADKEILLGAKEAKEWAEAVAKGEIEPNVTDSTPSFEEDAPILVGEDFRGWGFGTGRSSDDLFGYDSLCCG